MEPLIGLFAGLIGTIPMTILMWATGKAPPSSVVLSYVLGDTSVTECAYTRQNIFFHFIFGATFGVGLWTLMYVTNSGTYGAAILSGFAFGVLLTFVTGCIWFPRIFDFKMNQKQVVLNVFYHITYAITTAVTIIFIYHVFDL